MTFAVATTVGKLLGFAGARARPMRKQAHDESAAAEQQLLRRTRIDTLPCQDQHDRVSRQPQRERMICISARLRKPGRLPTIWMASALTMWSAHPCFAQCVGFSDRAPQIELDAFVASPSSLLEKLRNDKDRLSYRLAAYIVTDPSVLSSVQTLIAESASTDRSAIGGALRIAEARCTLTKPDLARQIRTFAQRLGDLSVQAGYSAAAVDEPVAQLPSRDKQARQPNRGGDLLEGEGKTKLLDPFKPLPIPR
jgi:hypothetical protein